MNMTRTTPVEQRVDAVVWIDESRAIVARLEADADISCVEIRREHRPESRYLGDVVHEIGNCEHVLVVGPQPIRLALERRYVNVSHRPDRLMATPVSVDGSGDKVEDRLWRLVA